MSLREPLHRRTLIKILLLITGVSGVIFFALNMSRGLYVLGTVELIVAAYSLLLYRVVSRTEHLDKWILAYLIPFLTTMMFALAQPGASDTIFVWVFLIPQISYLLTGVGRGFVITAFYLFTAACIFLYRFYSSGVISPVSVANIVICAVAIWSFAHHYEHGRERYSRKLLHFAERDSLTGLLNRMRLAELVESEIRNARARQQSVAIVLLDLDYFKTVNDRYGHPAGDEALIFTAEKLQSVVRRTDYIFRLGGEEFCILLPGADLNAGREVAESARRALEQGDFHIGELDVPFTGSFGVAVSGRDGDSLIDLYHAADQRLYAAKHAGRNRVVSDEMELMFSVAEPAD
ncbi:GGDEF domain-containing protein [Thalassolituus marinus]|uniref:diguanylate cyclase n=1 Tax=Thalassolituus marinus TaxID=671053 RepID=A0ABS7ZPE0_9GAMM|nr:diguanylate cyclase [Thalassolituus marinus]MCA6062225.1 GGDEF domain-containing protein [Thalassolituus marinus]